MENLEAMRTVANWAEAFELATLFEFSGVLLRTKSNTIDTILMQWHVNDIYYCWWERRSIFYCFLKPGSVRDLSLSVVGHFPKLELPYLL